MSGRPLVGKLGIGPGHRVVVVDGPSEFVRTLRPLPEGVEVMDRVRGPIDVAVLFSHRRSALERRVPSLIKALARHGGLWIAYPKRSSGVPSDLDFATVQAIGLGAGLVDNKSCAIDEIWTAVRFVYRKQDR